MYGKYYYVYIMSNKRRTVYYIGITSQLERRVLEHICKLKPESFTSKYNIDELLYFEEYADPTEAIMREKQLKGWTRQKKINLIKNLNPEMKNLFEE